MQVTKNRKGEESVSLLVKIGVAVIFLLLMVSFIIIIANTVNLCEAMPAIFRGCR